MFLEKLELQGFKSFASKTVLKFDKRMTAIVGPNGSGKSNLAESIRWVLGEQSMKTLRSKKSEDVIFAGTHQKSRLGMAEVSLYLNNEDDDKSLIGYDHLVITRRVFRSGESEYLINKNKARLSDIQQLLAKCGFGQKTYSVIGQGMIDSFLRATPRERQELFEEAANIKQYQLKRNLSLQKLVQSKQNLLRVGDHLDELLPRLRSLKWQAGRARRKNEIEQELRAKQRNYFNYIWNKICRKENEIINEILKIKNEEKEGQKILAKKENLLLEIVKTASFTKTEDQKDLFALYEEKNKIKEKVIALSNELLVLKRKSQIFSLQNILNQKKLKEEKLAKAEYDFRIFSENLKNANLKLEEKIRQYKNTLGKIKKLQSDLLTKDKGISDILEIENKIEQIFLGEERIVQKLKAVQTPSELKAIIVLASEYSKRIKTLLEEIREKRKKIKEGKGFGEQKTEEAIKILLEQKDKKEREINEQKVELAILQTKIDFYKEQIAIENLEIKKLQNEAGKIKENEKALAEFKSLEAEKTKLEASLLELSKKIKFLEDKLKRKEEIGGKEKEQKIIDYEREYKNAQEALNATKDKLRKLEIEKAKQENEKKLLFDEIKDAFGEARAETMVKEFLNHRQEMSEAEAKEIKEEISRLEKRFLQIGEIDPQVLAECQEVEKRYQFLTSQKEDLKKAAASLKSIIHELDERITFNFDQAIKAINEHFQKYFATLFGGGRAKLLKRKYELEKKENNINKEIPEEFSVFEAEKNKEEFYVEVKANPPGKKVFDLNMLSGGERALTSIALILAIITYHPTPFIVLDEADTALDEANSDRYAKIIEEVAKKTQFIAITHNRQTMQKAKVLYGVTMEESGVSKLLSVDLEKVERE